MRENKPHSRITAKYLRTVRHPGRISKHTIPATSNRKRTLSSCSISFFAKTHNKTF